MEFRSANKLFPDFDIKKVTSVPQDALEVGYRFSNGSVTYEYRHDTIRGIYFWHPVHPMTLYGEACTRINEAIEQWDKAEEQCNPKP